MKKCLYCHKDIINGATIFDYYFYNDLLCCSCRRKIKKYHHHFKIDNIEGFAILEYNEFFSDLLVQYKECMDEALSLVFLWGYNLIIRLLLSGYTIVYIPSSKIKLDERGFNHLEKIFKKVGLRYTDILEKTDNQKQVYLNFEEREKMINKIRIKKGMKIPKKILLVDDVFTTGSSLKGAIKVLSEHNCKVKVLVLAKKRKNHS
ncbi:MAG: ComF family protein [Anaerorhabdus sp.]